MSRLTIFVQRQIVFRYPTFRASRYHKPRLHFANISIVPDYSGTLEVLVCKTLGNARIPIKHCNSIPAVVQIPRHFLHSRYPSIFRHHIRTGQMRSRSFVRSHPQLFCRGLCFLRQEAAGNQVMYSLDRLGSNKLEISRTHKCCSDRSGTRQVQGAP